ncbi:hypothetical protein LguiA_006776 [Lonicera macranthoides]
MHKSLTLGFPRTKKEVLQINQSISISTYVPFPSLPVLYPSLPSPPPQSTLK